MVEPVHPSLPAFVEAVVEHGWAVTSPVLTNATLDDLRQECSVAEGHGGARNLLDHERFRQLARLPDARAYAQAILGEHCFAVRGLLFDKTLADNWKVPWHQDVVIAVREKHDVEGFGPWSVKSGVPHVQAPAWVLEQMIALRIHVDACGPKNGPLRVLSGSHHGGILESREQATWLDRPADEGCAEAGTILAMRPLLLHASRVASEPHHRRVIHLEFASVELPAPLEWYWRV